MSLAPYSLTLHGRPITKKNSLVLVKARGLILPSEAYRKYERECRRAMAGLALPHFACPVRLTVLYWLDSRQFWPDLAGLMQATSDIISDEYKTGYTRKRTLYKTWLLSDDRIIKSWDGTRIAGIDKANPRAEVTVTPLPFDARAELDPYLRQIAAREGQGELF